MQLNYPVDALKRHEPLFRQKMDEQISTERKKYGEQSLMNFVHSSLCSFIVFMNGKKSGIEIQYCQEITEQKPRLRCGHFRPVCGCERPQVRPCSLICTYTG